MRFAPFVSRDLTEASRFRVLLIRVDSFTRHTRRSDSAYAHQARELNSPALHIVCVCINRIGKVGSFAGLEEIEQLVDALPGECRSSAPGLCAEKPCSIGLRLGE